MSARASSSAKPIRVGLLGAGYIASWHAEALRRTPGVKLACVCDLSRGVAENLARRTGATAFATLDAMLADGNLDCVHVLTPPNAHYPAVKTILAAGIAAFVEKPFVLSSVEARELDELASAKGLALGVNHNFLMLPGYEKLKRDIDSRSLGPIDSFDVNWRAPLAPLRAGPYGLWMLRAPQHILLEVGPHLFAFVADLFGDFEVRDVLARYPVEIPGGVTHQQGWRISGLAGETAVAVDLSLIEGHEDRSVTARALGGLVRFDFAQDAYLRQFPAMGDIVLGPFAAQASLALQSMRTGLVNAGRQLASLNVLAPYGLSITRACRSFYRSVSRGEAVDRRLSAGLAVRVVEMIEQAARFAPPATSAPRPARTAGARPTLLVIGGSGFIGRALVDRLAGAGSCVRVFSRGRAPGFDRTDGRVDVYAGDLKSETDLLAAMDGIEGVFHLAKADEKTWAGYLENDVAVTRRIGECCLKAGVRRLVYTGTIASFDAGVAGRTIDDTTPLDPRIEDRDLYARSKGACETVLRELAATKGLPLVIARPGIVIGRGGPLQHWGVGMWRSATACKLWGAGDAPLPFVAIDDAADGLARAMTTPGVEGRAFFLVGDPMLSAREYFDEIGRAYGVRMRAKPTPIWTYYAIDLAKYVLKRFVARKRDIAKPTLHDWKNRAALSRYDNAAAKQALGWAPESDRARFVEKAIARANLFGVAPQRPLFQARSPS